MSKPKKADKIPAKLKLAFSEHMIRSLTDKFNAALILNQDALVESQIKVMAVAGEETEGVVGCKYDGNTIVHSLAAPRVNLSYMQIYPKAFPPLHSSLVETFETQIRQPMQNKQHEAMRFKAFINHLLSVCVTWYDFIFIFEEKFSTEVEDFIKEWNLDLNTYNIYAAKIKHTLSESSLSFLEQTYKDFEAAYNRYKFSKTILGI